MSRLIKSWKLALGFVLALILVQVAASLLVRFHSVHDHLEAQLSRAFGRSVQVRHFDVQILPVPTLGAEAITVGEDTAFGNEYFLRADQMSAGLRWVGLLRGRLELGTVSLSRPSLILVRSAEGRWNLERWLPPARRNSAVYGPISPPGSANRLRKIDFDDGRVNFKFQDDKQPFAFTNVSGSVEQISPGRWRVQLQATPWRSGVSLQSTGTMRVQGEIAGTSARLQPAEVRVHWDNVSLADLLRLWHGQDFGVRGSFVLDASLKSSASDSLSAMQLSAWDFALHARAAGLHRWDLGERADNPRLSLHASGKWFSDSRAIESARFHLDSLQSNIDGEFSYGGHLGSELAVNSRSVAVQASDLLAFDRAFHPGIDEALAVRQFFFGRFALHGWPLRIENAELSSFGGTAQVNGFAVPVHIGPIHIAGDPQNLFLQPVTISWPSAKPPVIVDAKNEPRHRVPTESVNSVTVSANSDFSSHSGSISVSGKTAEISDVLRLSQNFGHPLQHGWELSGSAAASLRWQWAGSFHGRWNGSLDLSKARLQMAGLNFPVELNDARLAYADGRRQSEIHDAQAFGAHWTGTIDEQTPFAAFPEAPRWHFALSADHLDAAELDRWAGPRARPNWLQRLLSSMLGENNASNGSAPSDLLRLVNAEGTLHVSELTVEKIKLENVAATARVRDLQLDIRDAQADWASGALRATFSAKFLPQPAYEFAAQVDHVNLAQLPGTLPDRIAGSAAGKIQLSARGIGRAELLQALGGSGDLALKNLEFRGWDLDASLADGAAHSGVSRWPAGKCSFELSDQSVVLHDLRLDNDREVTAISGKISFARNAELALETSTGTRRLKASTGRVLRIIGPLDEPRVSVENIVSRSPAD